MAQALGQLGARLSWSWPWLWSIGEVPNCPWVTQRGLVAWPWTTGGGTQIAQALALVGGH